MKTDKVPRQTGPLKMANINAIKLENKKIYLQDEQDNDWNIIHNYSKDKVSLFIADINKKMPEILSQIEKQEKQTENKETRRSKMFVEDYRFISESETEISLMENDFGKQMRIKNEVQSIFNKPRGNIFEEEEFFVKKVEDDKEIFDFLMKNEKCSETKEEESIKEEIEKESVKEEGIKEESIKESIKEESEEEISDNNCKKDSLILEDETLFKQGNFFLIKKKRKLVNWKIERAIEINKKMKYNVKLQMKCIKIKKEKTGAKKKSTEREKSKESLLSRKRKGEVEEREEVKKKTKAVIKKPEEIKEGEEVKKKRENVKKKAEKKTVVKSPEIEGDFKALKNPSEAKEEEAKQGNEISEDSFEGFTMNAPNFVSSFDTIFADSQFSEDSNCFA